MRPQKVVFSLIETPGLALLFRFSAGDLLHQWFMLQWDETTSGVQCIPGVNASPSTQAVDSDDADSDDCVVTAVRTPQQVCQPSHTVGLRGFRREPLNQSVLRLISIAGNIDSLWGSHAGIQYLRAPQNPHIKHHPLPIIS